MAELPDVSLLSKPERAKELSRGRILLYLFAKQLADDEAAVLRGFADEAGAAWRVLVARSPLPDRHQVRIGPALIVYEDGKLCAVRAGALESRAVLDRWLRAIKRAPRKETP